MPVDVSTTGGVAYPEARVAADAAVVLEHAGAGARELSVLLCDDATIHALNRDYRGRDAPTDVLAFAQDEGEPVPGAASLLGDVVISLDTAARQAAARGHDLAHEVTILLVHGICHLLGHDHEDDDEAERMEALERELLARVARSRQGAGPG